MKKNAQYVVKNSNRTTVYRLIRESRFALNAGRIENVLDLEINLMGTTTIRVTRYSGIVKT